MQSNGNLPVTTLYERVSKSGRRYMMGRWGKTRLLLFQADPTPDGTPTLNLELQKAGEYQPQQQGSPPGGQRMGDLSSVYMTQWRVLTLTMLGLSKQKACRWSHCI
jgi:hypothetical protein